MLIRYRRSEDGKPVAKAIVYTEAEHRIDKSRIDPDALRIIERLRENGHEAYVVGGAVRDLLLDRRPKDFDIVTDAEPPRIRRIFRNARVIGRRFRLVHVYAGPKIFEVSTFRSIAKGTVGNEYGTMDEDALRRDFTLNALYYDPLEAVLIDYVGGFKDMAAKRITPVIPLATIFKEDPVRMIRCVKYASTSSFRIPFMTKLAIKRDSDLLADASSSRLTEEFLKILGSAKAETIVRGLSDFDLLRHMLPAAAARLARDGALRRALFRDLAELDAYAADPSREKRLSLLLSHFLKAFLESADGLVADTPEAYQEAVVQARLLLAPLNPPRVELEAAVLVVFKKLGVSPLQKPRRSSGAERSRGERHGGEHRPGERRGEEGRHLRGVEKKQAAAESEGARRDDLPSDSAPGEATRKRKRRRKPSQARAAGGDSGAEGAEKGGASAKSPRKSGEKPASKQASSSPRREGKGLEPAPGMGESSSAKRRRRRRKSGSGGASSGGAPSGDSPSQ
ncbi:MAG: polynucleotide adenylyltransferase PcnB [Spirochaetaceae bacterium]|nr:polynucleotide adenylyltransferase PcnB [Spirochaetaceae bacterium]